MPALVCNENQTDCQSLSFRRAMPSFSQCATHHQALPGFWVVLYTGCAFIGSTHAWYESLNTWEYRWTQAWVTGCNQSYGETCLDASCGVCLIIANNERVRILRERGRPGLLFAL
eukprot:scaffold407899_cov33-Prasinocladus_malaysianus.AAC.1